MFSTIFALLLLSCFTSLINTSTAAKCMGTAKYRLVVKYKWTADRFNNRPSFPHFSPLVFHSHGFRHSAYPRFGYATDGVKDVAEFGTTTRINNELKSAQAGGMVRDIAIQPSLSGATDMVTLMVTVSCRHRYVSAITMVAPSPDWILALFRINLVRRNKFVMYKAGKMRAYDAGTDSGLTFTAPNQETKPRQNIAPLFGAPFFGKYLATYNITKM